MAAGTIYLDNAATTPLDPQVRESMEMFLGDFFGNPSSLHAAGRRARAAVEEARAAIAGLLHAQPAEIVFTASGTEATNLALKGLTHGPPRIVTSAIEHPAVLETCRFLEARGIEVVRVPVGADGIVEPKRLDDVLREPARLVSIMTANNVVGTVQPVRELARIAHARGALFHTDAVQAVGRLPINVRSMDVDMLSLSAHKFHGPQGVGALFVRKGIALAPLVHGGGQEGGLRSATENVAGIVGAGFAAAIAQRTMRDEAVRVVSLRDRILEGILGSIPNAYLIGDRYRRLPGHLCLGFAGQEGEGIKLLLALDQEGVAVSSGSACSAHNAGEPSHVLCAMGFDPIRARGSLRISLGRFNTNEDVERFLEILPRVVATLRPIASRVS